ncbi:unnamed protein product [Polarella glacialis]|uniref:Uncharacterized protein n=1 Tax=Polarella glacialis TaxID=89957 RepID=A0A813FF17_POLGL|nr:unnamed protein product [Polarella glacialis]
MTADASAQAALSIVPVVSNEIASGSGSLDEQPGVGVVDDSVNSIASGSGSLDEQPGVGVVDDSVNSSFVPCDRKLKVHYFFAGEARKSDMRSHFQRLCLDRDWTLQMVEIDLERDGAQHALGDPGIQDHWIGKKKLFNVMMITPECSNCSRAHWNPNGPPPIRSSMYPHGFPWLLPKERAVAEKHNSLIAFAWKALGEVEFLRKTQVITGLLEHPEDLGRIKKGGPSDVPASIWRWKNSTA